ncbi:MAG: hypothetical protein IPJ88_02405 [Myxococcales bacterium]|nr:MAG: hypothetical protein IPJ88_02405 [Myxococcales bacterium]
MPIQTFRFAFVALLLAFCLIVLVPASYGCAAEAISTEEEIGLYDQDAEAFLVLGLAFPPALLAAAVIALAVLGVALVVLLLNAIRDSGFFSYAQAQAAEALARVYESHRFAQNEEVAEFASEFDAESAKTARELAALIQNRNEEWDDLMSGDGASSGARNESAEVIDLNPYKAKALRELYVSVTSSEWRNFDPKGNCIVVLQTVTDQLGIASRSCNKWGSLACKEAWAYAKAQAGLLKSPDCVACENAYVKSWVEFNGCGDGFSAVPALP